MPDRWIDEHVGDESRPRPEFEDALASELRGAWSGAPRRIWLRVAIAAAAVVALVAGAVALFGRDDDKRITVASSTTSIDSGSTTSTAGASAVGVAIGESVMIGAEQLLTGAGVVVDAAENRGAQGTVDAVNRLAASGVIGAVTTLAVQVGTNAPLSAADLDAILAAIPDDVERVLFLTVAAPVEWVAPNNELIRALPARDARVTVVDWTGVSEQVELCPDGIHVSCNADAKSAYANLVLAAMGLPLVEPDTGSTTSATPTTATTTTTPTDPTLGNPVAAVGSYLSALADGRWLDAAKLLGEGGLEPEARADLRPLYDAAFGLQPGKVDQQALAGALEKWCAGALCDVPFEVTQSDRFRQVATFTVDGRQLHSTFVGSTFEGQPGVQGLPLQRSPLGDATSATVDCPTSAVSRTSWADVDGDGWYEQIVVQEFDTADTSIGGGRNVINVCGTALTVAPLELIDGEGIWVYTLDPTYGPATLLIGSVPPFPAGDAYRLVDGRLQTTGDTFGFITPALNGGTGESTGCMDLEGLGREQQVNFTYTYVGGTDLQNSVRVEYTVQPFGQQQQVPKFAFTLPDQQQEALELVEGYCRGLPVMTQGA